MVCETVAINGSTGGRCESDVRDVKHDKTEGSSIQRNIVALVFMMMS